MTTALLEARDETMARKATPPDGKAVGPIIKANLIRLGYSEPAIKMTEISDLVAKRTKRSLSRQRISAILNAVRVNPETIELLAKALGVKVSDLLKDD